ncbi:MAG: DUF2283 domain-containing protein [Candidatus Dormibacteraeota bacterium]|nr:DUF2283 domain-containing protein [Candidatus Dormibacteraeota bacterium]
MSVSMTYDTRADAIYVHLTSADGTAAATTELGDGRNVDYDADGEPIGVELLAVSRGVDLAGLPHAADIAVLLRGLTTIRTRRLTSVSAEYRRLRWRDGG